MKKLLPIGSVVKIKDVSQKAMIFGRMQKVRDAEDDEVYDYIACPYPQGNIATNRSKLFNHDEIIEIIFVGYQDNQEIALRKKLTEIKK